MRFHTSQYSRYFIPATTKLWNELPSIIVEATKLQKFKIGGNAFFFFGCEWTVVCYMSHSFLYIFNFVDFLSCFIKFFLLLFVLLLFSFLSEVFSFLTGLSSLLGLSGFWLLALPVGVCSLECNNNDNNNDDDDDDDDDNSAGGDNILLELRVVGHRRGGMRQCCHHQE